MTETLKIPAIRDPAQAAAAIMEHVAAIDALLGGLSWRCMNADDAAREAGCEITEAMSHINLAVKMEDEWHRERGE